MSEVVNGLTEILRVAVLSNANKKQFTTDVPHEQRKTGALYADSCTDYVQEDLNLPELLNLPWSHEVFKTAQVRYDTAFQSTSTLPIQTNKQKQKSGNNLFFDIDVICAV